MHNPLSKVGWLTVLPRLRRELGRLRPDVLIAYRIARYGFLAALSGWRPLALAAIYPITVELRKELWAFHENRIAVQFEYEWNDGAGQWCRSYGNEMWEFDSEGLMARRSASINDLPIREGERRIFPRRIGDGGRA